MSLPLQGPSEPPSRARRSRFIVVKARPRQEVAGLRLSCSVSPTSLAALADPMMTAEGENRRRSMGSYHSTICNANVTESSLSKTRLFIWTACSLLSTSSLYRLRTAPVCTTLKVKRSTISAFMLRMGQCLRYGTSVPVLLLSTDIYLAQHWQILYQDIRQRHIHLNQGAIRTRQGIRATGTTR